MVARGELTEGHARAVLSLPDDDARKRLAKRIAREGMSVRAAERAAQAGGANRRPRAASRVDPALAERARDAAERLTGLPARVSAGKLEIHFGEEPGSRAPSRCSKASSASRAERWAILDSNQGPPPYQSGALTS